MKKIERPLRVYNGAMFCSACSQCPVANYYAEDGLVKLSDPAKPEKGQFTMTVSEYNQWLKHGKRI